MATYLQSDGASPAIPDNIVLPLRLSLNTSEHPALTQVSTLEIYAPWKDIQLCWFGCWLYTRPACPQPVTNPSSNQAWCRATSSTKTKP